MSSGLSSAIQKNWRNPIEHLSHQFTVPGNREESIHQVCIALKRYRALIRWKFYYYKQEQDEKIENEADSEKCDQIDPGFLVESGCKLPNHNPPPASAQVENYLKNIERDVFSNLQETSNFSNPDSELLNNFLEELSEDKEHILVATDKTNSYTKMDRSKYIDMMSQEISQLCTPVSRNFVLKSMAELSQFIEQNENKFSQKEIKFMKFYLKDQYTTTMYGLYKDHKTGDHIRLISPENGTYFSGMKKVFVGSLRGLIRKYKINLPFNLKNSFQLIRELRDKNITSDNQTIISLDIVSWYPSMSIKLVRSALQHYALKYNFSSTDFQKLNFLIDMLEFVKQRSCFEFRDKFYQYLGTAECMSESGAGQGAWESADLSDLTGNFIFEKLHAENEISKELSYQKLYRDDSIIIFDRKLESHEITAWKEKFDKFVSKITENRVVFTLETLGECGLNFLDTTLYFNKTGELHFKLFMKKETSLKYLNSSSCHSNSVKDNIKFSVVRRLANLVTELPETFKLCDEFPEQANALLKSNLCDKKFTEKPFTRSRYLHNDTSTHKQHSKKNRSTNFIIPYFCTKFMSKSFHQIFVSNAIQSGLRSWVRTSITYSGSTNLSTQLKSDLKNKIYGDLTDMNIQNLACNCRSQVCVFEDQNCRKCPAIYKIDCLLCRKQNRINTYFGSTINHPKKRVNDHLGYFRKRYNTGSGPSDSWVTHYEKFHTEEIKKMFGDRVSVGDLRSCNASGVVRLCQKGRLGGGDKCVLCKWEKLIIFKNRFSMNSRSELFSVCRHHGKLSNFL